MSRPCQQAVHCPSVTFPPVGFALRPLSTPPPPKGSLSGDDGIRFNAGADGSLEVINQTSLAKLLLNGMACSDSHHLVLQTLETDVSESLDAPLAELRLLARSAAVVICDCSGEA